MESYNASPSPNHAISASVLARRSAVLRVPFYGYLAVITTIAVGADGDLWGLGSEYIYHYDPLQHQWTGVTNSGITELAVGSGCSPPTA